jgi:hypothetical protein
MVQKIFMSSFMSFMPLWFKKSLCPLCLSGSKKVRIRNPKLWASDDYAKLTPPDNGNVD